MSSEEIASADTDPEVEFAARLVDVFLEMRRDLSDEAVKRVLTFAMERCGIQFLVGAGLQIRPFPMYRPDSQKGAE